MSNSAGTIGEARGQERDLYRTLLELACCDEIDPFLEETLALMEALTGAARVYIELVDDTDDAAAPRFWMERGCYDDDVEAIRAAFSRGIIAEAIASGETIVTESARSDPRFRKNESVQRNLTEAVLCAPLGTPPIGVVYLQDRKQPGPFTEEHRKVVEDVARYLGKFAHRLLDSRRRHEEEDHTLAIRKKVNAEGVLGRSKALALVLQQAGQVAPLDASVLITGPSGTGKTQIARLIHVNSPRAARPFVEQNCAALQDTLIESELFGVRQGAHSTATRSQEGRVAAAEGGTLFLDEIGDLSLGAQAKLLQLLQSKEYYPVGAPRPVKANVRVLAATNVDLKERVAEKRFREDLFYRLDVLRLRIPSLAERAEDIAPLAISFCERAAAEHNVPHLRLGSAALRALEAADWSGNVRELDSAVQRAVMHAAMAEATSIEPRHLFPVEGGGEETQSLGQGALSFQEATRRFQKQLVERTLKETDRSATEAAKRLGLSRSHLYNLLETLQIPRKTR